MISIIIPTVFNDEAIQRCIRLIKANTDGDYEIIVMDNGSIARGCVSASNRGARAAAGDILVFMNDDCQPQPGWLPPLLNAIKNGVDLCSPEWQYARLGGHCLCTPRHIFMEYGGYDERYRHWCADHHYEMTLAQAGLRICQVPASNVIHDPSDPLRIHHRRSLYQEESGLPNTGQWYLEDQAKFEEYWGDKRPSDFWPGPDPASWC